MRKVMLFCVLFLVFSAVSGSTMEMAPIPDGADIVIVVNNHSGLPLHDLLAVAPIPAPVRDKMQEFFSQTSFNPLKDIRHVQLMVKKGETKREDNAVFVLSGSFNQAKIMEFVKGKFGQGFAEEKVGSYNLLSSKDGKGGLCFLSDARVALGSLPAVRVFLDAAAGTGLSREYDELKGMAHEKAYVALMVGGRSFLATEMKKNSERRQARLERSQKPHAQMMKQMSEYIAGDATPKGIFAQLLENRLEARIMYERDGAASSVQAEIEVKDARITVEKLFAEVLKALSKVQLPGAAAEENVEKAPAPADRW